MYIAEGGGEEKRCNELWPFYFATAFIYAISRYNPNILNADVYDADAYLTSIYNVLHNIPYSIDTTGIYGHYAIFFKLPMLVFGGNVVNISIMVAVVAGIAMIAFSYAVDNLIRRNCVKVLVIMAALLEPLYALPYSYYQTSPNRYLFPALMLALIAYDTKHRADTFYIGVLISSLGILWNMESGVASAAAWFVYNEIKGLQEDTRILDKKLLRNILCLPIEILIALGIYVIYNTACGGNPALSAFFYPYNHHLQAFALPIQIGCYAYTFVIPLFMSALFWAVCNTQLFRRSNGVAGSIGAISTIGIALFAYYMNRFAMCNVWMIVWEFALLLGILVDRSTAHVKDILKQRMCTMYVGVKSSIAIWGLSVLATLSLGNLFSAGKQLELYQAGTKDITLLKAWANEIEATVPKNTYAVGYGTWALYSMLDWDTGYHINDLPNLTARPEIEDRFYQDLYGREAVLVSADLMDINILVEEGNFEIQNTFNFNDRTYMYLKKKI